MPPPQQQLQCNSKMAANTEPFHVGFAISVYQNSGDPNTNWADFEKRRTLLGLPAIRNGDRCGVSTDFWNRYKEDIDRACELGSTCFRLSLEWSRIEPELGNIDSSAVERYHDILDVLISRGLEPFVTLHHFVHPRWFEALGGFEKEANISFFVQYTQTAFRLFGSKVRFWTTFNEANVTSFAGHLYGSFPPGKVAQISGCGRHLLHMLRAHTQAYQAIKALPGGDKTQIGLVHNWFWFEPKRSCCTPPYLTWLCAKLNHMWGNEVVVRYLQTGVFDWNPSWCLSRITYKEPGGKPGCDYIGLNYYSRGVIDWKFTASCNEGEVMTDMPYALYPQGLLTAIQGVSRLGVPVYITETGVAESADELRPQMIETYMAQLERAVQMGYDVRGVMYWTLLDNFEWAEGFFMKFGIYAWKPDGSQQRIKRKSAAMLERWYRELPGRVAKLRQQQQQGQQPEQQQGLHLQEEEEIAIEKGREFAEAAATVS